MLQLYYKAMLKHIKILDFTIFGCISYTKISRMVIFGLVFLVYFLKLFVGKGFRKCLIVYKTLVRTKLKFYLFWAAGA